MDAVIAEPLIQGDGTPEASWRPWLDAFAERVAMAPDWLPRAARLVVVAPHPDDEVLACGATLAMHAQQGGESVVVAVTDGEASHPGMSPPIARSLAARRRAEREEGLSLLGVRARSVIPIGLPDGQVNAHVDALTSRLTALLRPTDVVISTWRHDGHPDHDAAGRAAARACAATACKFVEAPVWMWHWAKPGDLRVPWKRLRALQLLPDAWARKQRALGAHASQLDPRPDEAGPVLGAEMMKRAGRACEHFFV